MATIDRYNLLASKQFTVAGTAELTENFLLTASTTSEEGIITGVVTSLGVTPIEGATVKVFNSSDVPVAHAITNPQGQYTIPTIVKGTYKVLAARSGYLTPLVVPVTVVANRPTTVNIPLTPDSDAALNTVYGIIRVAGTLIPLEQAIVNTYLVQDTTQTLISTTVTNTAGQYISPYLDDGNYIIVANKEGYDQTTSAITTLVAAEIASLDMTLYPNADTNTGTVSGIITDSTTLLPIGNATVALYQIIDTTETLLELTKTNGAGRYLFGSVETSNYIVKAFSQKEE
ncbi:MAG: carboxypeptidase-like regulatory domain-containing protein [Clostridiaceae bacterium]|nr:carboxypeptidase-like regulatory domain-containing protein [Clostridiaceae bacterium]